jgi:membrane associated rhomboid family serine protease
MTDTDYFAPSLAALLHPMVNVMGIGGGLLSASPEMLSVGRRGALGLGVGGCWWRAEEGRRRGGGGVHSVGACRLRGGGGDVWQDWLPAAILRMPCGTRSLLLLNLLIYLVGVAIPDHPQLGAGGAQRLFGLQPAAIWSSPPGSLFQAYRAVTHAFVHSSLLHVAVNMMSLSNVGTLLEEYLGTAQFLYLCAQLLACYSSIMVGVAAVSVLKPELAFRALHANLVGISGVLFGLFTVHALAQVPFILSPPPPYFLPSSPRYAFPPHFPLPPPCTPLNTAVFAVGLSFPGRK